MAAPTPFPFGAGFIEIGDDAPAEVFTKICGFKEMKFDFDKELNDTTVPDCDDPDAPAWTSRDVVGFSASFSLSGLMVKESLPFIEAATLSGLSRNVRITIVGAGTGGATPNKRISGRFHVKHGFSGERGNKFQIELSGENDGAVTVTSVAAA